MGDVSPCVTVLAGIRFRNAAFANKINIARFTPGTATFTRTLRRFTFLIIWAVSDKVIPHSRATKILVSLILIWLQNIAKLYCHDSWELTTVIFSTFAYNVYDIKATKQVHELCHRTLFWHKNRNHLDWMSWTYMTYTIFSRAVFILLFCLFQAVFAWAFYTL